MIEFFLRKYAFFLCFCKGVKALVMKYDIHVVGNILKQIIINCIYEVPFPHDSKYCNFAFGKSSSQSDCFI